MVNHSIYLSVHYTFKFLWKKVITWVFFCNSRSLCSKFGFDHSIFDKWIFEFLFHQNRYVKYGNTRKQIQNIFKKLFNVANVHLLFLQIKKFRLLLRIIGVGIFLVFIILSTFYETKLLFEYLVITWVLTAPDFIDKFLLNVFIKKRLQ